MRVVAGSAGGLRLAGPRGRSTRPTTDRVREAVFNRLQSRGLVEGASVLDLFAGSGAMGIEALSRGAAEATFVDDDPRAVAVVKANLASTGLGATATVVRSDVVRFLRRGPGPFDLAVLDPPYDVDDRAWAALLAVLPAAVAVLESDRPVEPGPGWELLGRSRYGGTVVSLARAGERGDAG